LTLVGTGTRGSVDAGAGPASQSGPERERRPGLKNKSLFFIFFKAQYLNLHFLATKVHFHKVTQKQKLCRILISTTLLKGAF
jgi:hypothetical protein